ncbi:DNA-binding protein WhiA [Anaerofustis stercorihominis]|uniref:DNA-binding protein WhiA n=1 Tax=Anaerofustis stercorihominis TaxID=214853 RepID=UPI00214D080A|nr:DNA-binding protein WhiA [Anaerofustis stercorihominis]MCR2033516.1 DNA-binding protein WhiA [Anaerofustis stercorihominis]
MSFCSDIKNNLCHITLNNLYEKECELYGYLHCISSLSLKGRGKLNLIFETENPSVARRIFALIKDVFSINIEIAAKKNNLRKGHFLYNLIVMDSADSMNILDYFNIIDFSAGFEINNTIKEDILPTISEIRHYLRGVFLSSGYVSDPKKKGYQIEFVFNKFEYAKNLIDLLKNIDINLKYVKRKEQYVIYTKDSSTITEILGNIGAHNAVLEIESTKVIKEMRNNVNRRLNCETANMDKTVNTALKQINAINKISDRYGMDYLDEPILTLAKMRLNNPDASLNELSGMFDPPISRSTINNWFKKILKIADSI